MRCALAAFLVAFSSVAAAQPRAPLPIPQIPQRSAVLVPDEPLYPGVQFEVGAGPRAVAGGDLNGDGRLDLAVANAFSDDISIVFGDGGGRFSPGKSLAGGTSPRSVAIGDLNGDGKPDVVVASFGSNDVSVHFGNGKGSFPASSTFAAGTGPR